MIQSAEALSTARNTDAALDEIVAKLSGKLDGPGDLTLIFSSMHHVDGLDRIASTLRERGLGRVVLGCTCESVVGEGQEIEASTALAVWTVRMPGAELTPFSVEGDAGWPESAGHDPATAVLLLADPFRFPIDNFLHRVATERPGTRIMGGMASGGSAPGQNRLLLDNVSHTEGAVGVVIRGDVAIRSVVSQGCRPIGRPMIVTKAERNIIRELGRIPALEVVQELFGELSEEDQELVKSGLHIGRVINEYQESFGRGDFLVRNVMGADQTGGIAISDLVRVGQTVQFHVRDAETADEDLRHLLTQARIDGPANSALLFTCNGRGSRLFREPNHDVSVLREILGPIPAAGFFAMGELGPVGGQNFIHGFTASVVLFSEK
jgi:small ligand-binding sensory domain FIST